jgi:hypothetical protein
MNALLEEEKRKKLSTLAGYEKFARKVAAHRDSLVNLVRSLNQQGKRVIGYGASTKGNVLLQYCGFGPADIPYIAEVNERKFGSYTPGTGIPIISEKEARAMKPDYFLVLPWHFRDNIIQREAGYVQQGGQLIFPLPELTIFPLSSSTTVQDNVKVGVLENVSA